MQIVIDIDINERDYKSLLNGCLSFSVIDAIMKGTPIPKCHNENNDYADCDQFVCSECGIELQDWHRVERDIDDGDITYHEYTFKYCPNCGAECLDLNT